GAPPERGIEGVFDTMLAAHGALIHAEDHYARLQHDVGVILGPKKIPAFAGMTETIKELLDRNNVSRQFARVRTSVTRDMILIEAFPCPDPAGLPPLICAVIDDWPRAAGDPL